MGLDMYLRAEKYVSGYGFSENKEEYTKVIEALKMTNIAETTLSPSLYIKVTVLYWRKANAIHSWFVTNVQNGVDECEEHEVSLEQLKMLRAKCDEALTAYNDGNKTKAELTLTPKQGFFFGSYEVDEWYAKDLKRTIERLDLIFSNMKNDYDYNFYYQSSW